MTSDSLVDRLRRYSTKVAYSREDVWKMSEAAADAADRIEELEAEKEELKDDAKIVYGYHDGWTEALYRIITKILGITWE